jgi:hypothetical protein
VQIGRVSWSRRPFLYDCYMFATVGGLTEYVGVDAAEQGKRYELTIDLVRWPADKNASICG